MPRIFPALLAALLVAGSLAVPAPAAASEPVWIPPAPASPTPPLAGQKVAPSMKERRIGGGIQLIWSKSIQTSYLAMQVTHVIAEATGQDASKLVFVETGLLMGHGPAFVAGPWGYALVLDDERPHRRHLGLAIGLTEQTLYALLVGSLNVLGRHLFVNVNSCHIPDERGCIDHHYAPASRPQAIAMFGSAGIMGGFAVLHWASAIQVKRLEAAGVMDGPAGDEYRKAYEIPKPKVMVLPVPGGVAVAGTF